MTGDTTTRPAFVVVLDESPLSLVTQRRYASPEVDRCKAWLASHILAGHRVVVPAIAVYELRRELVRADKTTSLDRLAQFLDAVPDRYIPLTREALDLASELWAQARRQGRPTASDDSLDGDVIVAAQALTLGLPSDGYVIATSNPGHMDRYAPALHWRDVVVEKQE